jgi:hypothetical protein
LSTSGVETEFYNTLLKIGWEDEKEDINSYSMTIRKLEDTGK